MKRYLSIAILISVFIFVGAETALACTCTAPVGKSDKELVDSAKTFANTVFMGRVIKIVKKRNRRGVPVGGYNALFEVNEIWKGKQKKQVRIYFNYQCCLCLLSFSKGKEYLVYADGDKTMLTASTCGRTREISDPMVKIDLQYLGSSNTTASKN